MYCGVPKNRAARSAPRPNASVPNAPWRWASECGLSLTEPQRRAVAGCGSLERGMRRGAGGVNHVDVTARPPKHVGRHAGSGHAAAAALVVAAAALVVVSIAQGPD